MFSFCRKVSLLFCLMAFFFTGVFKTFYIQLPTEITTKENYFSSDGNYLLIDLIYLGTIYRGITVLFVKSCGIVT